MVTSVACPQDVVLIHVERDITICYMPLSLRRGRNRKNQQIVELPTENKGARCGKAQGHLTGTSKVALKTLTVPFVSDSTQITMGLVLLDTGNETTLIRTGFAGQLGVQGPKQNLTVDAVGGVTTTVKSQRVHCPLRHL